MVNRNKARGTNFESAVVQFFKNNGYPYADRLTLSGANDRGDVRLGDGIPVCIEAKNTKAITLSEWLNELEAEMKNSKAEVGAVIAKRRGKGSIGDAYAIMTGDIFLKLLKEAGYEPK